MKRKLQLILFILQFLFVIGGNLKAQQCLSGGCTNFGSQYPSVGSPYTPSSSWQVLNNPATGNNALMNAGNYTRFSVTAGNTYEWSYCESNGGVSTAWDAQMTLFNDASLSTPICFSTDVCGTNSNAPYIGWVATFTGTVRILTTAYTSSGCQTNSGSPYNKMAYRQSSSCTVPSTQANSITFTSVGQTSITASWTNGNGSRRVVYINTTNSFTAPSNGTNPTASTTYSGGQQCIYNGTGTSVSPSGLSCATTYYFRVYEANCNGSTSLYFSSTATNNPNSQITSTCVCSAPTTQANNISFSTVGLTSITASWTNGNGSRRVVYINSTNSFTAPSNGTSPTASTSYSGGQQCIYNGSGTNVVVTSLTCATTYYVRVYEANCTGSNSVYYSSTASSNPNSQATSNCSSSSLYGVDISHYNGTVSWSTVYAAGKSFAYVKSTEGVTSNDSYFTANMSSSNPYGVVLGAYHLGRPDFSTNNTPANEANHFLTISGSYIGNGFLPPALDMEPATIDAYINQGNSYTQVAQWINSWCTLVHTSSGKWPVLYVTKCYAANLYSYYSNSTINSNIKLWIATNNTTTDPAGSPGTTSCGGSWSGWPWVFHQYFAPGGAGNNPTTYANPGMDQNIFNGSTTDFNNLISGSGCIAPSTQASNVNFSTVGQTSMTANWTNGNGSRRVVYINTSNSFTAPSNGANPTGSTNYNGGQQCIYNGTGTSVVVTGLTCVTTYYVKVYEANCTGSTSMYNSAAATNNPNNQVTANCGGSCTTCPSYDFSITPTTSWQTHSSAITTGGCKKYYVSMNAGSTYYFSACNTDGGTASYDSYFILYNSSCTNIAFNDDYCNTQSYLTYTPTTSGIFYFEVSGYGTNSGTYNLAYKYDASCTAPTIQSTDITFSGVGQTSMNVSWTFGNGSRSLVYINTTNSFTAPSNGTDPSASNNYSGGQQCIYNGSGNSVTVMGLICATSYYFRVYEANCIGNSTVYYTAAATNNPNTQATPTCNGSCMTCPSYDFSITPTTSWQTHNSSITTGGCKKYYLSMNAGNTYYFSACASDGGSASYDTYFILYNSGCNNIAFNDDYCNTQSYLTYTPISSGVYYFGISGYSTNSGIYNLAYKYSTSSCTSPTTQSNNITFPSVGQSSLTVNWTNGDGNRRVVYINSTKNFTAPPNGTDPTASTNFSGGQQCIYNGNGNSATVTGLSCATTYYVMVYEANCIGSSSVYNTANAINNPNSQITTSIPGTANVAGSSFACSNSSQNYTASASDASFYQWTVPSDWTINSGQGTSSINVTVGLMSGQVCSTPSNSCGMGTQSCKSVSVSSVVTSVINNGIILTSNASPATYQWVSCPSMQAINGENKQTFTPSQSGSYAVIVTQNSCSGISNCYQITMNGLSFTNNSTSLIIYPNPANSSLTIKGIGLDDDYFHLTLTNSLGQILIEKEINIKDKSIETQFDISEYTTGIYFLTLNSKSINHVFKVQKQ